MAWGDSLWEIRRTAPLQMGMATTQLLQRIVNTKELSGRGPFASFDFMLGVAVAPSRRVCTYWFEGLRYKRC